MLQKSDLWHPWDTKHPPSEYIFFAPGTKPPDRRIRPSDSVVITVKAVAIIPSDKFPVDYTLRFARFESFNREKDFKTAISLEEFAQLNGEIVKQTKKLEIAKKANNARMGKKKLIIARASDVSSTPYAGPRINALERLMIYIITDRRGPDPMTKGQLSNVVHVQTLIKKSNMNSVVSQSNK